MQPYMGSAQASPAEAEDAQYDSLEVAAGLSRVDALNLLVLLVGCVLVLLLLPPQHEYAVIDDWIYAGSVRNFSATGVFTMPDATQANLFGLTLWGTLWVKLLGFSFTLLTYSTLVMAAVALGCFYGIARALRVPPAGALLGTALLALNPIFLDLSYSFMTDVPFMALTLAACYLYIRGLQAERIGWLVAGGFLAGWSYLIRQYGILTPMPFVFYLLAQGVKTRRWRWSEMLAIVAFPVLSAVGWVLFRAWQGIKDTPAQMGAAARAANFRFKEPWLRVSLLRSANILPVVALSAWAAVVLRRTRWWLVPMWAALIVWGMLTLDLPNELWLATTEPPFTANLGPLSVTFPPETYTFGTMGNILRVEGFNFFQYQQQPIWSPEAWRLVWFGCILLGALLLAGIASALFDWARDLLRRRTGFTLLSSMYLLGVMIIGATIVLPGDLFDRYVMGFLPFVLLFVVRGSKQWGRVAWAYSVAALAVLACFSLLLKADMIAHDNVRMEAAEWLTAKVGGVNNGFEWNYWKPNSDKYAIADFDIKGFHTVRTFPYTSLLSGGETRYVHALARDDRPALP